MKFRMIVVLLIGFALSSFAQGRIEATKIGGTSVDVYLPPNYSTEKQYPVVYFNDGQMLFGHPTLTIALQDILDSLIDRQLIQELMVVGIFADQLRTEKYVPYQSEDFKKMEDGGSYSDFYADYLLNNVIPYIDKTYSTLATPRGRAIFGFSFGGLNAIHMLLNHPQVFSMAAGISASMWVDNFALYDEAKKYQPNQRIWFDIGTGEWNYYVPFQKLLKDQGAKINEDVFYFEVKDGVHTWEDVRQRVHMPLLVFIGVKEHKSSKMNVEVEIIPSKSTPGKQFTRLNPIVTCSDGLKYSLAYEANYSVLNPEAGKVAEEGSFELFGSDNLEVEVTYKEFSKKVKIRSKLLK